MRPAAAATLPPAMRTTAKARRWRYSHGWIRRCRPGRRGVSHHPRRPFGAVLSLSAFIGVPPVGVARATRTIYQSDITLIDGRQGRPSQGANWAGTVVSVPDRWVTQGHSWSRPGRKTRL